MLLDVGSSTAIETLGTIGTGVWQGTAVASAYLDADTAHLTTDQTFSGNKTFSAPITASGNISASGKIYSDNEEILWNGSGRGASLAPGEYASPGQHGVNYTVWSQQGDDNSGAGIGIGNSNVGGIHLPYSCSIVGVVGNINTAQVGQYRISLWHKKLASTMGSTGFDTADLLFETANISQSSANRAHPFFDKSGAESTFVAASGSVLHWPSVIIPSIYNVDASDGNAVAHFSIIVKRWGDQHQDLYQMCKK